MAARPGWKRLRERGGGTIASCLTARSRCPSGPRPPALDDLDLLLKGCFAPPLDGFVDPSSAPDGAPITLVVTEETAEVATAVGRLDLVDPEGAPLASLAVTGRWDAGSGRTGLVGPVERLAHNEFGPFRRLHRSPADVHQVHPRHTLLAVPVTAPLSSRAVEAVATEAEDRALTPVLLVCVGDGMPRGVSGPALVRTALAAAALIEPGAQVVAVSVADHGDAGVDGGPSPNQWLLDSVVRAYADTTLHLEAGDLAGPLPAAIEAIVARDRPPRSQQAWSSSSPDCRARASPPSPARSSTPSSSAASARSPRWTATSSATTSRRGSASAGRTARPTSSASASLQQRSPATAVLRSAPIAPFDSTRQQVRRMVERAGGGFVLVHVATPLEECERRDRKGLYARARAGEIVDFTGISSPYEPPTDAVKVDTTDRDIAECLAELLDALAAEGWLHS